ncbi:type II toxin-antitoxin system PemK/MazF family toxin [Labrys wisconsinensis]|uniref:mRNA-degrading endonuclease toxin of MazEF toxin-antitoxin module n=1 Tax=Labrys wisconsinensis TaxID=425677 RepID=A0ABU0J3X6_9HYPH|nr:type II toxin-antitoxin system PemK/MazF family toxin [Labrys wisconsinensis]MDQ0468968.1 mRNA-degrading endonuclease toxin of MazEF toxin-antitoxin module [Labrys wisconsinensis]
MTFPSPVPGLVIRYSYLWLAEHRRGQEEGVKDRPCAVVLATTTDEGRQTVVVLPITHTPQSNPQLAVEIPTSVKRRIGLDDERSWVMLTEANQFAWPAPDLRPARHGDASSVVYGPLPYRLFEQIRQGFIKALKERRAGTVPRTE